MAKQLDNSLVRFSQHQRVTPMTGVGVTVAVFLAAGLIMAIFLRAWPFVALFALSLIGVCVYSVLNWRLTRKLTAAQEEARIDWEAALPEVQRESLNIEVVELSKIHDVNNEQMSDLQSAYIVAEDLALRQIQQEEQVPVSYTHLTLPTIYSV